jgi:hypothetical protein
MKALRIRSFAVSLAVLISSVHNCAGSDDSKEVPRMAVGSSERRITVVPGRDTVLPHFVDGGGWQSSIFLTNMSTERVYYVLMVLSDTGAPLPLPFAGMGDASIVYGSIAANESIVGETTGTSSTIKQGYVHFLALDKPFTDLTAKPIKAKVGGMGVFRLKRPGSVDLEAVVPMSSLTETTMHLPFDNTSGFTSAYVVLNPDLESATYVLVTVRDDMGAIMKSEVVTIPKAGKVVWVLPEKYPQTAGKYGRVTLTASGALLSAMGLRFNPGGAFTSFHPLSLDPGLEPPASPTQPAPPSGIASGCSAILNTQIFANDGTYLGKISDNPYLSDSIANPYGQYGSPYSSTSIYNTVGRYGSSVSSTSAFNSLASQPPILYRSGVALAYLTTNTIKVPRVDSNFALGCIGRPR